METLTFKGSVPEAIFESKGQKKLFVVYISGEDEESDKLNRLTWTDASVAESLSKYCILLHIQAGSVDATNFSAIYPYSSVPCIAAIGFSGTQVWKNEGFIAGEALASSLEKAWLGLHIQETTASILSAAMASQNSGQPASSTSNAVLPSEGGPLDAAVACPSTASSVQPSETKSTVTSASTKENKDSTAAVKGKESAEPSNLCDTTNNQPASSLDGTKTNDEHGATEAPVHVQEEKEPIRSASPRSNDSTSSVPSSTDRKRKQETVMNKADSSSGANERDIDLVKSVCTEESVKPKDEGLDGKVLRKSSDVHLNIRLPDGASLQEKFSVTSILRIVKDYVSSNQTAGLGAYDLAVPYPRKVYSDQDLDKSLSELGLFDRQALVVVPRKSATVNQRGSSYSESNNNTDPNSGGYFAYVRRVLSFANPFSYFGGGTASPSVSSSGPERQTRPNTELRNNMGQVGSSFQDPSEGRSNVRNRRPTTTSRIGSNIHTLNHNEDDASFGDGNAFWNGNSTQYGGGSGGDNNDRR
ncbi:PREDICTED: plant UBX domain-containing protein 11 isoform X2 [Camelina sativa]|uniref:Plant UBX domain-containing protein 11 isoform X2 n=1 Tax=Camelina sativa TaxID=90675 RepID=A0ABM0YUT2_CAMSA|nr:PREDICTED: plant UBX domain-containing protein 11 isoform X2 [Camelina sativa]